MIHCTYDFGGAVVCHDSFPDDPEVGASGFCRFWGSRGYGLALEAMPSSIARGKKFHNRTKVLQLVPDRNPEGHPGT